MWIAKEAGYYQGYGLDVTPEFGVHPVGIAGLISGEVQFSNYSLDDVAAAAMRDPVLVVVGSILHRATFALMVRSDIANFDALRGKRVGVGRVGDPPYHYTVGLMKAYGLKSNDVQWVPTGTDAAARVTMLISGQIDAALITPPSWYRVEALQGLKPLTLLEDHPEIVITVGNTYKKSWVAVHPDVLAYGRPGLSSPPADRPIGRFPDAGRPLPRCAPQWRRETPARRSRANPPAHPATLRRRARFRCCHSSVRCLGK